MPTRMVREGIIESERVDKLSPEGEVFYRRGMSTVDDHGRYYAKPELLIAALYPLRIGKVIPSDIEAWLVECVDAKLIRTYVVDGKKYLEYLDFRQQVRSKSKFPAPPDDGQPPGACEAPAQKPLADAQQLHSKRAADAHLFEDVFVSVSGAKPTTSANDGKAYSPEFEEAWSAYPRREGGNPKLAAWKAWRARIAQGASPAEIIAGVQRYAAFVRATGKEGTPYVKQASSFLGPDNHFREPWSAGNGAKPGQERRVAV